MSIPPIRLPDTERLRGVVPDQLREWLGDFCQVLRPYFRDLNTDVERRARTFRQDEAPTDGLRSGDVWFDTDDNSKQYRWSGTAWELATDSDDHPRSSHLTFAAAGGGAVSWGSDSADGCGSILYQGHLYSVLTKDSVSPLLTPTDTQLLAPDGSPLLRSGPDSTTKKFIYWDPHVDGGLVLQATDDIEDLRGQECFLGCLNLAGVAHPQNWQRIGVDGDELYQETVKTGKVEEDGVTQQVVAFTAASTFIGQVETEEQTASIVTVGGRVEIYWGARISPHDVEGAELTLCLYRATAAGAGETLIRAIGSFITESGKQDRQFLFSTDTPVAGSWRYYLKAHTEVTTPQLYAWIGDRTIKVSEFKR